VGLYSKYILPHLLNCACGARPITKQRQKIVPRAEGVVLEIGFGSGLNLPHYDAARVKKLFALEPEQGIRALGAKAARSAPFPVEIVPTTCEAMPLSNQSVDMILVTYTLCTIPDAVGAMRAAKRVLKPGGKVLFCEHGLAPDARVQKQQRAIEPLWKVIAGGCHVTRDVPALLQAAGYRVGKVDTMYLPSTPKFAGFNVWGEAA
jgi:ubiquinone/menaquinone biosynthesis C-methylase UbiE